MPPPSPLMLFFARAFRPFFLGAGLYAVVAMGLWLLVLQGRLVIPGPFAPLGWHAHEMLFGFAGAAVAGFVLTASPSWTGRPPVAGGPLALLVILWLAARLLIALPTPWLLDAAVETGFWLMLTGLVTHEVVVARNTRNLPVSVALGLLGGASAVDWLETAGVFPDQNVGPRLALTVLVGLIALIGGRIVPNFTRTWLKQHQISDVPPPPDPLDHAALGLTIASMAGWTAFPQSPVVALLLALAGLATLAQLARWRGAATGAEGLVWILHVAYAGVPVGLLVLAAAVWQPAWGLDGAALHALGAGAITLMVVAIMTRATLGHSGLALRADAPTRWIYGFLLIAALARGGAAVPGAPYWPLLLISGGAWIAGFLIYLGRYGVIQVRGAGPKRP